MFCTFSLPNLLFATAACIFSTSELPKVLSEWGVLYIFTSKCAFRHSGVHFFDIRTSKSTPNPTCFVHFHFQICFSLQQACIFSTSELPKVLSEWGVLYIFTSKCAFRHSGVHLFDIWTAKSASELTCFVHLHFRMCISPQRRAFFRHLNSKKCFGPDVFCTFSLRNVLFATAACNFLISPLTTWLRTRRFNRPTFGLTPTHESLKNTAFRDFSNIWRGCIFFLLTFALLHLLSADLTTRLCFSTVHIVGSFYLNFLRSYFLCGVNQKSPHYMDQPQWISRIIYWGSFDSMSLFCWPSTKKAEKFLLSHQHQLRKWVENQPKYSTYETGRDCTGSKVFRVSEVGFLWGQC